MWQNVAFILIGLGVLALIGWNAETFFTASGIPLFLRIAVGFAGVGVLILIGVAVRDRFRNSRAEKFKEVER